MPKTFRDGLLGPEMIEIERGYYRMGTDLDQIRDRMYLDEAPAREVSVDKRFSVSKFPITFTELWPFAREAAPPGPSLNFFSKGVRQYARMPAVMMSWHAAQAYCHWLSLQTGHEYRLLTEVEWEYVCRADTETDYWWGDDFLESHANSRHEEAKRMGFDVRRGLSDAYAKLPFLTEVDAYPLNPWGIGDMLGNTWDWVSDRYEDRRTDPQEHAPTTPSDGFRSLRGGSWMDPPLSLRAATRSWADPVTSDAIIGLRVARELDT